MKKPFEVGQRVAVYGGISGCIEFGQGPRFGTVLGYYFEMLDVELDSPLEHYESGKLRRYYIHPKQCRRLRKKRKPKVVEFEDRVRGNDSQGWLSGMAREDLHPLSNSRVYVRVVEIMEEKP